MDLDSFGSTTLQKTLEFEAEQTKFGQVLPQLTLQGNKPVIGASVAALVERPTESGQDPVPPMEIELLDNGGGKRNS